MNQQPKIDKIIQTINDAKVAHPSGLLADAKRLSDLLDPVARKDLPGIMSLMIAPEDMTELEKAIVCVALYWFYRDVVEYKTVCGNASKAVEGSSEQNKEVPILFDSLDMQYHVKLLQNGEIGTYKGVECPWGAIQLFWEAGKYRGIFDKEGKGVDVTKKETYDQVGNDPLLNAGLTIQNGSLAATFYKILAGDYGSKYSPNLHNDENYKGGINKDLYMLKDALPNPTNPDTKEKELLPGCAAFANFVGVEALNILMGNDIEFRTEHFGRYFNVVATTGGNVIKFKDRLRSVEAIESEVGGTPRAGGFFWGDRSDGSGDSKGNHMGVVIKVDEANQKYGTIEGNRKRHDELDGVAAGEYTYTEGKRFNHRFLSLKTIGERIASQHPRPDVNGNERNYKYTSYFTVTCWQDPNTPPPPVDKTITKTPPPQPADCAEAELAYSLEKNA